MARIMYTNDVLVNAENLQQQRNGYEQCLLYLGYWVSSSEQNSTLIVFISGKGI